MTPIFMSIETSGPRDQLNQLTFTEFLNRENHSVGCGNKGAKADSLRQCLGTFDLRHTAFLLTCLRELLLHGVLEPR